MTSQKNDRITFTWRSKKGSFGLIAYADDGRKLVRPLMDYCAYKVQLGYLDAETIKNDLYLLKSAFDYMLETGTEIEAINDDWIKKYRHAEYEHVFNSKNSRKDVRTAKRTVNQKLIRLYQYLFWYQERHVMVTHLVGPRDCQVLAEDNLKTRARGKRGGSRQFAQYRFPLLYKRVGSGNDFKHSKAATDEDVKNYEQLFFESHTQFTAVRNVLVMRLADQTGLRRASINSLTCDQFSEGVLDGVGEMLHLCPRVQKFGYLNIVKVPVELALQIASFIQGERVRFLDEMGWDEARTEGRIFFSAKDGAPLRDRTWSSLFGKGGKALGLPAGHALHAFRFKNVGDRIDKEIRACQALGLDTSTSSIADSVSLEIGQKNPASLRTYVTESRSKIIERHTALSRKKSGDQ